MPLTFAKQGEKVVIQKIGGKAETKKFWKHLVLWSGDHYMIVNQGCWKTDHQCKRVLCCHQ